MVAVVTSCSNDEGGSLGGYKINPTDKISLSRSEEASLQQSADFSLKLFNSAAENFDAVFKDTEDNNMSISPISLQYAMAMVANCADQQTAGEITRAFGFNGTEEINSTSCKLMRYLAFRKATGVEFSLANSMWFADRFSIDPVVSGSLSENYFADIYPVDFSKSSTVDKINGWCSEHTNGLIDKFVEDLPSTIEAAWYNALYMRGEWNEKFDASLTKEAVFHGINGDSNVQMMSKVDGMYYAYGEDWQSVALPFKGKDTFIYFVLPSDSTNAVELSKKFSHEDYLSMVSHKSSHEVALKLPRFTVKSKSNLDVLLGLEGINLEKCDFPAIVGSDAMNLYIDQKCFIEVNEEGAKIAAVTGVTGDSAVWPLQFVFDRPFLFFVVNRTTNTILMGGRICDIR